MVGIVLILPAFILVMFKSLYNPKNAYLSAYSSILIDYLQLTAILSLSLDSQFGSFWHSTTQWAVLLSL